MSLLGFNAVGRFAIGQIGGATTTTIMAADVGSFSLTGISALFPMSMAAAVSSYSLTGINISMGSSFVAAAGSFTMTGVSALFIQAMAASVATFSLTGLDALLISSTPTIVRRFIENGGICLGFDSLSNLALTELPETHEEGDSDDAARLPLYRRGVSYWKGRS